MMVKISLTQAEVYKAIAEYISRQSGVEFDYSKLKVETKSVQNHKSEWETAAIRVECEIVK